MGAGERLGQFEAGGVALDVDGGRGGQCGGRGRDGAINAAGLGVGAQGAELAEAGVVGQRGGAAGAGDLQRGGEEVVAWLAVDAGGDEAQLGAGEDGDGRGLCGCGGLGDCEHALGHLDRAGELLCGSGQGGHAGAGLADAAGAAPRRAQAQGALDGVAAEVVDLEFERLLENAAGLDVELGVAGAGALDAHAGRFAAAAVEGERVAGVAVAHAVAERAGLFVEGDPADGDRRAQFDVAVVGGGGGDQGARAGRVRIDHAGPVGAEGPVAAAGRQEHRLGRLDEERGLGQGAPRAAVEGAGLDGGAAVDQQRGAGVVGCPRRDRAGDRHPRVGAVEGVVDGAGRGAEGDLQAGVDEPAVDAQLRGVDERIEAGGAELVEHHRGAGGEV